MTADGQPYVGRVAHTPDGAEFVAQRSPWGCKGCAFYNHKICAQGHSVSCSVAVSVTFAPHNDAGRALIVAMKFDPQLRVRLKWKE